MIGKRKRVGIVEIGIGIFLGLLAIYIAYTYPNQLKHLGKWGYLGAFIIAFLSAASIFIPAPGLVIVGSFSNVFSPLFLSISAGLGAGIGEFTGYLAGEGIVDLKSKEHAYLSNYENLIKRYGPIVVFIFATFPNPIFDIIGISAGLVGMPKKSFLIATVLGNIVKYALVCYSINLAYIFL